MKQERMTRVKYQGRQVGVGAKKEIVTTDTDGELK